MNQPQPSPSPGRWSALGFVLVAVVYLVALLIMMGTGQDDPADEPWATVFNLLNFIAPLLGVPIWCTVHTLADPRVRAYTLSACVFTAAWAVTVCANRFIGMIMVPQSTASGHTRGLEWFATYSWPSVTRAIEMLGWGVFFAAACILLSFAFSRSRLEHWIRATLLATGLLSFVGATVGLALDSTVLMGVIAPVGWGAGPAIAAGMLAVWFNRRPATSPPAR